MLAAIIISLLPLCFKTTYTVFQITNWIVAVVFIVDYILRLATADFKLKRGWKSFFIYPFTPMAIIDLVSILPFFVPLNGGLKALRLLRLITALRAIRFLREAKSFKIIADVLEQEKTILLSVLALAIGYIIGCALIVFNVEPQTFNNFFDAVYWATISLLTVGYGDIYPVTDIGRFIAMISSIFGVALIALPSGIITGGYMTERRKYEQDKESDKPCSD